MQTIDGNVDGLHFVWLFRPNTEPLELDQSAFICFNLGSCPMLDNRR
jgi:hypothetical protein